jgi:hypothetical protein
VCVALCCVCAVIIFSLLPFDTTHDTQRHTTTRNSTQRTTPRNTQHFSVRCPLLLRLLLLLVRFIASLCPLSTLCVALCCFSVWPDVASLCVTLCCFSVRCPLLLLLCWFSIRCPLLLVLCLVLCCFSVRPLLLVVQLVASLCVALSVASLLRLRCRRR